jgi:ring-1,2-phenylacetyl-CoA epoxidase subunit PaaD
VDKPLTTEAILTLLETIADPEIPAISIVDLGIIQAVSIADDGKVTVDMTPTYAGCPALHMMQAEIIETLHAAGVADVQVNIVFDPPWSSDRISVAGRQKMQEFGIAPPPRLQGGKDGAMLLFLEAITCPFCQSSQTHLENPFGPTSCRAIYYCDNCHQPFELFKPL